jgi:RNA polymerase primary sigma factor
MGFISKTILIFSLLLPLELSAKICEEVVTSAAEDPLRFFLNQVSKHPRLTGAEEQQLAKNMEAEALSVLKIFDRYPQVFQEVLAKVLMDYGKTKNTAFAQFSELSLRYQSGVKTFQEQDASNTKGIPEVLNGIMNVLAKDVLEDPKRIPPYLAKTSEDLGSLKTHLLNWRKMRDKFAYSNIGLVVTWAKIYRNRGPFIDLIQMGTTGLTIAVHKFDYRQNTKFSTHATRWIKQNILHEAPKGKAFIRVPRDVLKKLNEKKKSLLEKEKSGKTDPELERQIEAKKRQILKSYYIGDIHGPNLDEDRAYEMEDTKTATPDEIVGSKDFMALLAREVEFLKNRNINPITSRAWEMVKLHYGLETGEPLTLLVIGKIYGIRGERVRQIIRETLETIKENFEFLGIDRGNLSPAAAPTFDVDD